ncbi:MAG: Gfo/Idh/MocA family oxidoreductase [bacterium]|jgi:predicted dehydrogenase
MRKVRVAVAGAGAFGRNHIRVVRECPSAELAGIIETDPARAAAVSAEFGCPILRLDQVAGRADAAIVAVPTTAHTEVGCALLEAGLDILVEKPIATDPASARRLIQTAATHGRLLQVGHLERFNPAVIALRKALTLPLFFEIHRLSVFSPRSLDVDVVRDLMIHDLDIVLSFTGEPPEEIRAAGISILSRKVDIASARLAFSNGCVANLTASRVSTERVRKLRLFQPRQYISLDYARQDAAVFEVGSSNGVPQISHRMLPVDKGEPLRLELESFFEAVSTRSRPAVTGEDGLRALEAALAVVDKIEEHARRVGHSLAVWKSNENCSPPGRA